MWRTLATFLLTGLLFAAVGCSSRGLAPVISRSETPVPSRTTVAPATQYRVQRGDTLYSIAWRQNLEYDQLAVWNGIRGPAYNIYPGQRLRLTPPAIRQQSRTRSKPAVVVRPLGEPAAVPAKTTTVSVPHAASEPRKQIAVASRQKAQQTLQKPFKLSWHWPTNGNVVQTFSPGDDNRKGIWIHGAMGQPVTAAEAGKVVYAGNGLVGYGNLIIIKHDAAYLSAYGYNSKLMVNEGDMVKKGEVVAHMGSPNSGGQPLLHFEIRKLGKPVNPLPLLPQR